jgi:hypothetical protein
LNKRAATPIAKMANANYFKVEKWAKDGSKVERMSSKWHAYSITRFNLRFDILPNDKLEAARTGNWFLETNFGDRPPASHA